MVRVKAIAIFGLGGLLISIVHKITKNMQTINSSKQAIALEKIVKFGIITSLFFGKFRD